MRRDITETYPAAGRECMRQPDADTNGRNLRFVLVADLGLPSHRQPAGYGADTYSPFEEPSTRAGARVGLGR